MRKLGEAVSKKSFRHSVTKIRVACAVSVWEKSKSGNKQRAKI